MAEGTLCLADDDANLQTFSLPTADAGMMNLCRYGEPQPGKVILPPNLACPYCKAAPAAKTLHRHNREVSSSP